LYGKYGKYPLDHKNATDRKVLAKWELSNNHASLCSVNKNIILVHDLKFNKGQACGF
jgi:hypothetical protein